MELHPSASRDRFLARLKLRGPQTAATLATDLGITGEAARQQLFKLAAEGLVEASAPPCGVGRPAQIWQLTEKGSSRFPDTHAEVTVQLIRGIRAQLGEKALDRLLAARAGDSVANYRKALVGAKNLGECVRRLAEARSREGYMAECQAVEGGYLLIENHCPICLAATECQGFCRSEQEVFQKVLGREVTVERVEHILGGDRRCVYRIMPETPHPQPLSNKGRGEKNRRNKP
jgi:predicted ArsR family transcriptional regulator